jgi:hypothetical protein
MTGSKKKRLPVDRKTKNTAKKKSVAPVEPLQLRVALTGDQRLAENIIIEVLAAARRCGLEAPSVQVIRQLRVGPKQKLRSGRKRG